MIASSYSWDVGYTGIAATSCGYQSFYGNPSYAQFTARVDRQFRQVTPEPTFTAQIKKPRQNPNGYRQRKLKARLNRLA